MSSKSSPAQVTLLNEGDSSDSSYSSCELTETDLSPVDTTSAKEFKYIVTNAIPVIVTFAVQYLIQIVTPIYFASQLGTTELSACTLTFTTFYLSGPVIFNGFSTSMDTLCSTAFGAKNYARVGLYWQRCTLILLIALIPSSCFWFNALPVVRVLANHNEELAVLCQRYLRVMPFAAPAVVIYESSKRFLQSQSKFTVPTRIAMMALPLSVFLNIKLRPIFQFLGPPISFALSYWFMCISILTYIFFIDGYQCWNHNITLKGLFSGWGEFFKLGIPGIIMVLSESFAFQLLTIMASRFGIDDLASQSILTTLANFAFQAPFAVGLCSSTRLANTIGSRSLNYKVTMKVILCITCVLSVWNFAWMVTFNRPLASLFTKDEALINKVCKLLILVGFNQFLDCFNIVCAGVLRGQGRQRVGSTLSLVSYYIVAIPFEFLFGFYFGFEVFGLWMGLCVGVSFLSVSEIIAVINTDWLAIIARRTKDLVA